MPDGKICFKYQEFFGTYNPYDKNGVDYWYCTAGNSEETAIMVKKDSPLPRCCPNMFDHAKADLREGRKLPEIRNEQ